MPDFVWRAANAAGKIEQGRFGAPSSAAALRRLREQGLTPLQLEPADQESSRHPTISDAGLAAPSPRRKRSGPVNADDVLALTSELAIMLRSGVALDAALRLLISMAHKPSVAALSQEILESVKGGAPLSRALAAHRETFGDFYINMVHAGEISGQLSGVFDRLVEHMESRKALRDNIISATIYPLILLIVAVLSLVAMLGFVVPQFEKLFLDMGDALPLPTRMVMGLGQVFTQYGLVLGALAVVFAVLVRRWARTAPGRRWLQTRMLRLPILGQLTLRYQLTLFSRSLGTLLTNGVSVLVALHIASETVGNVVVRDALSKLGPVVKGGGKMVQAVAAAGIFEPLAVSLIRVGEETGNMGPLMLELANVLNREVETGIKRLLALLEPVLILVLGILIGAIIVSILLGILSINDLAA
ncbi:type II secretion system F family protein [Comamonas sp. NLF-1-9]|uniref:type II secretion system F family protein n=1 Tax=Comamonas sp. NLF-1-9 TaxID=2853163 RepID=UPI001C4978EF|nr:type II secretion system F family protein [Comamonas sp. NLF-1-9]QXL83557.1 type II secretion system F family protein [Comamonas sp. NLF-1-9]